jgi:hypothetical protein
MQIRSVREGLMTVIPAESLNLLRWNELQLRVCGESVLDLARLRAHTVFAPRSYNDHPIVEAFWEALAGFSTSQREQFLQFAWARRRLPQPSASEDVEHIWRMKINILATSSPHDLPTAETCFFNVSMPKYPTGPLLREKLLLAITMCSSITS